MIDSTVMKMGPIEIGSGTYIGPFCVLGFPQAEETRPQDIPLLSSKEVRIGEYCTLLSHVVVGEDTTIGSGVWCDHHSYIGCSASISDKVQIMYGARIYHRVRIGKRAWISGFVCNDAIIEADAVVLGTLVHKFVNAVEGIPEKSPIICEKAFIGMNAVIIGGIEVGVGAYVAAGAVLAKSALPGRLYMGIPARDAGPAPCAFMSRERR